MTSTIEHLGDVGSVNTKLEYVNVYGVDEQPSRVLLNEEEVHFTYISNNKVSKQECYF